MILHLKLRYLSLLIIFTAATAVYSQTISLKVIASGGKAEHQKQSTASWQKVKTGDILSAETVIKISDGDYLGLIASTGKSLELKKAGLYKCSDLIKSLKSGSGMQKFIQFVYNESVKDQKKSSGMTTLGAVVRSRIDMIDNMSPSFTLLTTDVLPALWGKYDRDSKYIFKLINENNISLYITELKDTSLTLDLSKFGLSPEQDYKWFVYKSDKPEVYADSCTFQLIAEGRRNALLDSMSIMKKEAAEGSSLEKYIYIQYLTAHHLNNEALNEYEKLIKNEPDVEEFVNSYVSFLVENNISKKEIFSNKSGK